MEDPVKRLLNRWLLVLVLLGLLGMPAVPPPVGAIQPLWAQAADLQRLKSYTAAVGVYEQIAATCPQDPQPLLAAGEIYVQQGRWPLAEDAFNRALARDGENARGLAGLAAARWGQGDRSRAVALWQAALARQPDLPGLGVRLALAYLDLGQNADAAATLRQGLARAEDPAAHLYLAMIQALEDSQDARRELGGIADDGPPSLVAAHDYMRDALDKADAAGSAAGAAKSLGLAFTQIEEWPLARQALERALALDPSDAEVMAFLGHAEAQLGRPAFDHLAAAVAAQPDWPLGHYLLGRYYVQQEAYEFAAEEFRVTLRLDPGNAQAQADLGRAYVGLGQYLAAEEALVAASEAEPEDLAFRLALARFYADHTLHITDRGLAAARAAADLAPEDPQARDLLGWMYFLAGDVSQARLHLESALRLDPELVSAYYHLGLVYKLLGQEETAHFAFSRVIDLDTGGFYRDQAQTVLREMTQASK
jgi:tetratricopeptide (TPR) repeat protein